MPPDCPGTYVLILRLPRLAIISVGHLGCFQFPAGCYAYVGSARGPGGLVARISRHLRAPKPVRWHIDYLRAYTQPIEIWYAAGTRERECAWAQAMAGLPGASIPAPRFGASDCRCPAHLIFFAAPPDPAGFAHTIGEPVSREVLDA